MSEEHFSNIIDSTRNSAPGPDAIPYIAWRKADERTRRILYRGYVFLLEDDVGSSWTEERNDAFLVFLDKIGTPGAKKPKDTIGLSLSNTVTPPH